MCCVRGGRPATHRLHGTEQAWSLFGRSLPVAFEHCVCVRGRWLRVKLYHLDLLEESFVREKRSPGAVPWPLVRCAPSLDPSFECGRTEFFREHNYHVHEVLQLFWRKHPSRCWSRNVRQRGHSRLCDITVLCIDNFGAGPLQELQVVCVPRDERGVRFPQHRVRPLVACVDAH